MDSNSRGIFLQWGFQGIIWTLGKVYQAIAFNEEGRTLYRIWVQYPGLRSTFNLMNPFQLYIWWCSPVITHRLVKCLVLTLYILPLATLVSAIHLPLACGWWVISITPLIVIYSIATIFFKFHYCCSWQWNFFQIPPPTLNTPSDSKYPLPFSNSPSQCKPDGFIKILGLSHSWC